MYPNDPGWTPRFVPVSGLGFKGFRVQGLGFGV